jgi:hypothetical protein
MNKGYSGWGILIPITVFFAIAIEQLYRIARITGVEAFSYKNYLELIALYLIIFPCPYFLIEKIKKKLKEMRDRAELKKE